MATKPNKIVDFEAKLTDSAIKNPIIVIVTKYNGQKNSCIKPSDDHPTQQYGPIDQRHHHKQFIALWNKNDSLVTVCDQCELKINDEAMVYLNDSPHPADAWTDV